MSSEYDVAAYVWPAYHDEPRARLFFPDEMGEWERVIDASPKFEGHRQPRKPRWGYVNEADPRVMEMKIDAAADYGVNTFIYDWYWYDDRPFLEEALNEGYLQARNNDRVGFYLMWANHDATTLWDIRNSHDQQVVWEAGVDRAEFENLCERVIDRYFGRSSYHRIDGKPVFAIYDLPTLVGGLGGAEETRAALDWFRERAADAGHDGLHLQAILRKEFSTDVTGIPGDSDHVQQDVIDKLGFDSLTHYQWCHLATPKGEYSDWGEQAMEEWERIDEQYSAPYFPHVSIGWDNNPRFEGEKENVITGNEPEEFERFLAEAREFVDDHPDQPPLVTINSWNEWSESSYLEPDERYGYAYLEAVQDAFEKSR
jgi:hypothetical protein